jgi:hypothetical protein
MVWNLNESNNSKARGLLLFAIRNFHILLLPDREFPAHGD